MSDKDATGSTWRERILSIHKERITPEIKAAMIEKQERSRSKNMMCKQMKSAQNYSSAMHREVKDAFGEVKETRESPFFRGPIQSAPSRAPFAVEAAFGAMRQEEDPERRRREEGEDREMRSRRYKATSERVTSMVSAVQCKSAIMRSTSSDDDEAAGVVVEDMSAVAERSAIPEVPVAQEAARDLQDAAEELRKEPADDEERSAKFLIFDAYMSTVTALREQLFEFWQLNKMQFAEDARAALNATIVRLDSNMDNLGIQDNPSVWIVFGMMKKAAQNHATLAGLIREIECKIALIAEPADCPCCLEALQLLPTDPGKPCKLLSCCHKVCADCWVEWSAICRPPICPLCRTVDFLATISQLA